MVPASAFRHVLGTDRRISEYQVVQTAEGAEILAVGTPNLEEVTPSVIDALRRYGLSNPKIRIQAVDRIPRHQDSGKLRRFIPLPFGD
jgi:phenylacetate-CoA ligase